MGFTESHKFNEIENQVDSLQLVILFKARLRNNLNTNLDCNICKLDFTTLDLEKSKHRRKQEISRSGGSRRFRSFLINSIIDELN